MCGGTVESGCTGIDKDYRTAIKTQNLKTKGHEYHIANPNRKFKDENKSHETRLRTQIAHCKSKPKIQRRK